MNNPNYDQDKEDKNSNNNINSPNTQGDHVQSELGVANLTNIVKELGGQSHAPEGLPITEGFKKPVSGEEQITQMSETTPQEEEKKEKISISSNQLRKIFQEENEIPQQIERFQPRQFFDQGKGIFNRGANFFNRGLGKGINAINKNASLLRSGLKFPKIGFMGGGGAAGAGGAAGGAGSAAGGAAASGAVAVGWPVIAIGIGVVVIIAIFLLILNGSGGSQNPGQNYGCPDQATIEANKQSPETCQYFNPSIDIHDDIDQAQIDTYVEIYWASAVSSPYSNITTKEEFREKTNIIVQKSRQVGLNPVIFLGYWKSESLFGDGFGCIHLPNDFNTQIECAVGLSDGGAKVAQCAAPNSLYRLAGCQTLKSIILSHTDIYDKSLFGFDYSQSGFSLEREPNPIPSFDAFVEGYGPRAPNLNGGTPNYNCTHTYNTLLEVAISINACTTTSNCTPAQGQTFVLDPGHGDPDYVSGKTPEGKLNIAVVKKTKDYLALNGITTLLTHEDNIVDENGQVIKDKYPAFQARNKKINSLGGLAFISIHFDSNNYGPSFIGPRSYYNKRRAETEFNSQNINLGNLISSSISTRTQHSISGQIGTPDIDEDGNAASPKGTPLYVLGPEGEYSDPSNQDSKISPATSKPGVLNEYFTGGTSYEDVLNNTSLTDQIALGYCDGILKYLKNDTRAQCKITQTSNTTAGVCNPGAQNFVYYCQGNTQWANTCDLGSAGCGPTSLAMILSSFGNILIPPQIDDIFHQNNWRGCGDYPSNLVAAITNQSWLPGLNFTVGPNIVDNQQLNVQRAKEFLNNGYFIIASSQAFPCANCRGGPGTTVNHIFAVDDIDVQTGNVDIRDANNCSYVDGNDENQQNRIKSVDSFPWYYAYPIKKVR